MTVDFLPFANDASAANVVTQADYLAAASGSGYVQNGFPSGRADSNKANKAIRQSSVMVAALAQFISAKLSASVLDSGGAASVTAIQAQLAAVLAQAEITSGTITGITDLAVADGGTGASSASGARTNLGCGSIATQDSSAVSITGGSVGSAVALGMFPAGTALLFAQTAAPAGWTKSTTHNDKMLRIVSGTAGSGGSAALSTAWSSVALSGTVAGHTLTVTELPSHTHSGTTSGQSADHHHSLPVTTSPYVCNGSGANFAIVGAGTSGGTSNDHTHNITTDGGTGGGSSHTHGLSINSFTVTPAYVDAIICVKS
jgi:hypothetical protein